MISIRMTSARWAVIHHRGNRGCHPSGRVQPEDGRVALVPAVGIVRAGQNRSANASHPRDQPFIRRRDLDLSDWRRRRGRRRPQHTPPVVGLRVSGDAGCGTNDRRERNLDGSPIGDRSCRKTWTGSIRYSKHGVVGCPNAPGRQTNRLPANGWARSDASSSPMDAVVI